MKRKLQTLFVAITLIFSCNIALAQLQNFSVGQTAPDFTVTDEYGTTQTLYQYTSAGKYVLVEFFAYW